MLYFIKSVIYQTLALLIKINLLLYKKEIKKKLICNFQNSFGDSCAFYLQNYDKIIKQNKTILTYSKFEKNIASFFFHKKRILSTFFFVPKFIPIYTISLILDKYYLNYFKKYRTNYKKKISKNTTTYLKSLIHTRLIHVSKKIKKLKKNRYIVFYVKHLNEKINDLSLETGAFRQTADKKKIFEILHFLIKKKYHIIILGDIKEKINSEIKKTFHSKNIIFFKKISENQSMIDQLHLHWYSKFALGTDCGAFIFSIFLNKKILFFDSIKNNYGLQEKKNINFLFKKISMSGRKVSTLTIDILKKNKLKNKKFNVHENNAREIKKKLLKYL